MTTSEKKITAVAILLAVLGIMVIIVIMKSLMLGPGVPPPEYLPGLLIPESDLYAVPCSNPAEPQHAKYFTKLGSDIEGNYAGFPELSRYSSYGRFHSERTNNTLVDAVWYFDNEKEFKEAQQRLLSFLKSKGTVGTITLNSGNADLCRSSDGVNNSRVIKQSGKITCRVTSFTSDSGSGIFLAISRPLIPYRDDFYLQYVGIEEPENQSGNANDIRDLVLLNNRPYSMQGTIGELA